MRKPVSLNGNQSGNLFSETKAGAGCRGTGSKASTGKFFIHIDAQDAQDLSGDRREACTPAIGSSPKGVRRLSEKSPAG